MHDYVRLLFHHQGLIMIKLHTLCPYFYSIVLHANAFTIKLLVPYPSHACGICFPSPYALP